MGKNSWLSRPDTNNSMELWAEVGHSKQLKATVSTLQAQKVTLGLD